MTALRRIWITGASTGIGRAVALELAKEGAQVAASARSEDKLNDLAQEAEGLSGRIVPLPLDVTDRDACRSAADKAIGQLGGLDCLLLVAGTYLPIELEDWNTEAFETSMSLNFMGSIYPFSAALPQFRSQAHGHVAFVGSAAGYRGLPTGAAYGSSKAAIMHLVECLHIEAPKSHIKAQLIAPGFVKTPLTDKNEFPMPFLVSSEEAARRIVKGLKSNKMEIVFPRRLLWPIKLMRLLPNALYFPLIRRGTNQ